MSFDFGGSGYLSRTAGVPASHQDFSACGWYIRDPGLSGIGCVIHFGTGTNPIYVTDNGTELVMVLQYSSSRRVVVPLDDSTWIFWGIDADGANATFAWRYEGEASLSSASVANSGGAWTTAKIFVGTESGATQNCVGLQAMVRVWDAAIGIAKLYAESLSATAVETTDLLSDHRGDGANIAAAIEDDHTSNNDFTVTGTVAVSATEPTVTVGGATHSLSGGDELPVITSVDLSTTQAPIIEGDSYDLTAAIKDQQGVGLPHLTGTPASDDTDVATVSQLAATDASGNAVLRVVGVAPGTATITFTVDGVASNAVSVTVVVQPTTGPMQVFPGEVSLDAGATKQFAATIGGEDAAVTWTVPAGGGLIDGDGLYTAPASAGTATVRATLVVDSSIYAEATVTISASTAATATAAWPSAAGLSLDYWVFNKSDGLIASGTKTADADGSISISVPSTYVGELVNVAVNNLDSSMSTAGKVHGQKVVTVV